MKKTTSGAVAEKVFPYSVLKIISGGQTGVDRAGLDAARKLGMSYGGYIPKGRRTEDGKLPPRYSGMEELPAQGSEHKNIEILAPYVRSEF